MGELNEGDGSVDADSEAHGWILASGSSRRSNRGDLTSTSPPRYFIVSASMNSFNAIPLTLLATVLTAAAAPRFALVRVKDLYTALPSTAAPQQQIKSELGYDVVFDSSGDTNTGVPFVLFSKDAPDLTADIQAALKDRDAASAKPVDAAGKAC
jgi:hypothetical protein